jgi:hypothetical protein
LGEIEPGALHVVSVDGKKTLLKNALPADRETAEPKAVFGTQELKRKKLTEAELQARLKKLKKHPLTKKIPEAASRVFEEPSSSSSSAPAAPAAVAPAAPAAAPPAPVQPPVVKAHKALPDTPKPPLPAGLTLPLAHPEDHPELYGWYWASDKDGKIRRRGPKSSDHSWGITLQTIHYQKK